MGAPTLTQAGASRPLHHGDRAENMREGRGAPLTPFGESHGCVMPRTLEGLLKRVVGLIERVHTAHSRRRAA
jgi:hypothetical protein